MAQQTKRGAIRIPITYNDGLTTMLRRFSKRKQADFIATWIREHDIEARVSDRTLTAKAYGVKVTPQQRYEILVKHADFGRAYSLMIDANLEWSSIHEH